MRQVMMRGLLAHKSRLAATFVAVALGVAFVGGVLTLTDTMNRTFDDLFATVYDGTDAVVRSESTIGSDFEGGEQRGTVDQALLAQVQDLPDVAAAEGAIEGYARIIDRDGDPVGDPNFGATIGGNWLEDENLNPFNLRSGEAPRADDEIVMDAASAESTNYAIGDQIPVQTPDGVDDYELVGIAGFGTADSAAGGSFVMFTTDTAQRLIGEPGRIDGISVVAASGVSESDLVASLRDAVAGDADLEVLSGTEITEESQSDLRNSLVFVTSFFLAFAAVAVVVGSFVIYNSFSIVVAQRTREMALLRAIGAARSQVRRAVLLEASVVGFVGSVVGFVFGLGLASLLAGLMDIDGGLAVLPQSVAIAVLVGMVVTLTSALIPARRASKVPPVAAMRDVAIDSSGRSLTRFGLGLAALIFGVGEVFVGANSEEPTAVGLGVGVAFLGLLLAGPGLARPVSAALGWPLGQARGVTGDLARENARRNPRRSASTAQALMIGVGIVAFFMVLNSSIRASLDKTLEDNFNGDLIVDSGTMGTVGVPHDVALQIAELPDVEQIAPMRFNMARDAAGDTAQLTGTTSAAFTIVGQGVAEGSDALGAGEVVITQEIAEDDNLGVGDRISFEFIDTGTAEFTVAGIYAADEATAIGDYVIGSDEMARYVADDSDYQIMVQLQDGASVAAAENEIEKITDPFVTPEVQTVDEFKDALGSQLDVFLQIVLGLLVLAIVIALLGIANTIGLSVLERTRELGLLRAVGMSRRQLRATIRWESVIIALFGTTLGLAVGILGGWGLVTAFKDEGFEVFQLPVGVLAVVALAAGMAGMLAAVVPAWRASRLDVLDAIHTE